MLAAAGAAVAGRALWLEPRRVSVTHVELELEGWPEELDGLRVGAVADLHTGSGYVDAARVGRVAARLNAEAPDLIALLGDYVDSAAAKAKGRARPVATELGALRAPLGTYAVLGNHDWDVGGRRIAGLLREAGITVLRNDAVELEGFWLVGLDDPNLSDARVGQAFERVPPGAAALALSHDPDTFRRLPRQATLTLAGHTHGAQVALPLLSRLISPSDYVAGVLREDGKTMYVSRGVGTTHLPLRFRAPPEIALLTLRAG